MAHELHLRAHHHACLARVVDSAAQFQCTATLHHQAPCRAPISTWSVQVLRSKLKSKTGKRQRTKSINLRGADHILPTLACLCHALSSHAARPRRLRQFWCCNSPASRGLIASSLLQKWTERVASHPTPACHRTQLDLHGRTHHTLDNTIHLFHFTFLKWRWVDSQMICR